MIEHIILGLSLYTWHTPQSYDCYPCGLSNNTPGVYVIADDWTAGYVRNSLGHPAWYAGKVFHTAGLDFTIGAITGYQYKTTTGTCGGNSTPCRIVTGNTSAVLRPLVAVSYQFDWDEIKPRVTLFGKGLHISVEYVL